MSQFTLALFETTALSGLTLGATASPCSHETVAPLDVADQPPVRIPAHTFRLDGERALAKGWKARASDNLAAIRILQQIESDNRHATPDEQDQLALFVGFGASELANALFRRSGDAFRPGWEDLGNALEKLVSPAEMAALARSTQYAHYTPEFIVRAVWTALIRLGFRGGNVLEPGCGTGLFLALMPEKVAAKSAVTGIEMDPTTARISKLLYPEAWIRNEDFTKARLPEPFDLAVGNPPFSDRTVRTDDLAGKLALSLHDFFIARAIERLKAGGLAAFVTSRYTMDKADPKARAHIAEFADLVGAVRMPQGAMADTAGTDVVVDVLFFQRRRVDQQPNGIAWIDVDAVLAAEDGEPPVAVNRYFVANPQQVLGLHGRTTSQFGVVYTCHARPDGTIEADLATALETLPRDIHTPAVSSPSPRKSGQRVQIGTAAEGAAIKEGSYLVADNSLMQVINGVPQPVAVKSATVKEGIFAKHARIIRGLLPVRDAVRGLLRAQEANQPWGIMQGRLRTAYQGFVRQFGPINQTTISTSTDPKTGEDRETVRRPNLAPFLDDPDVWLVSSIETYNEETGTATMGPIFSERVIHPPAEPVITSAADALAVTLRDVGRVDIAHIVELLGRPREAVLADLGEAVFLDPQATTPDSEAWQTADDYLAGAVRTKLAAAIAAAALDLAYSRNVDALRRVQPVDLQPSEVTARLGAPWITAGVIEQFCAEVIGVNTRVRHTVEVASWSLDMEAFAGHGNATQWGTVRRHAGELLWDAMNASVPQIYDVWKDADGEHRVLNATETEAAKEKLNKIKQAFERWIWTDIDRTERLVRIYNDRFNNLVPRAFDGRHLQLPGASSVISLRDNQKRVIWRIISAGGTYIAHAVGAGKTFSMAAAVMEQKRLALIGKAMMVVPGHCLAQASREFLLLYPNARILVADETNFAKDKRQRFLARAATATWDCIIITHSAFKFIPAPADFEKTLIGDAVASYETLLEKVEGDDRITRKRIERMKEGLEAKLEALRARKDDMLTIAEMGVDQLIIDEAQEFRKLSFATNMSGLKGVAPDGSQRAWDLHVKARFIAQRQPTRSLILASGTPITNTLGEMFTLQRLMQPAALHERGIHEFDAWASNFGDTRTELELQPSGAYKPVTRFAEFVNVPELVAMFRSVADVLLMDDLREHLCLPAIRTGKRQIITAKASQTFRAYQAVLAERIRTIEERKGRVQKGDDILLSVITDGRHAAIDTRFVQGADTADDPRAGNEPDNKLNALIANVHRIWRETATNRYTQPGSNQPYAIPGAAQMIFSDLGTEAADGKRGFSAYLWIREELVRLGVPREQIAFMQDFKKSEAKQKLFAAVNSGKVRVLIGSTQTMGTGVNAQQRLAALHHLDVPWLPSDIEQREGRIERQGNQNAEIGIYAYATLGSVDATSWQLLERKSRFIAMALAGDRSVRRLEDAGSQVNQFAMAKALASGDPRLMQKAGLEAELARLKRLRSAHFDDQLAARHQIANAESTIATSTRRIECIAQDIAVRTPTRGDLFVVNVGDKTHTERKVAGGSLLNRIRLLERSREKGSWTLAKVGGFDVKACGEPYGKDYRMDVWLDRHGYEQGVQTDGELTPLGLIARLEYQLDRFDADLIDHRRRVAEAEQRLHTYKQRLGVAFELQDELDTKAVELKTLDGDLAANRLSTDNNDEVKEMNVAE